VRKRTIGDKMQQGERPVRARGLVVILLCIHTGLLGWAATRHSPSNGEVPALAAGVRHLQLGRFNLFRVNPPLVRMVAGLCVLPAKPDTDWSGINWAIGARPEFQAGRDFIRVNGQRSFWLFTLARWACIPFSLLGALVCFCWARDLYGRAAGILALGLWCFSPNIIAHAQMITPDAGAAALGLSAGYLFWRWLKHPNWSRAILAGLALGLAELTKTTWIVLFGLWPILWGVWNSANYGGLSWQAWRRRTTQLAVVLLLGVYLVNVGYGFEGSFQPLGQFDFTSEVLGGEADPDVRLSQGANRFRNHWTALIPVPLPRDYVLGIDIQKRDFEVQSWSYLRGQWRVPGWWCYYLYALAVKVPLGTWLLTFLALGVRLFWQKDGTGWRDELVLLVPVVVLMTVVSWQTGINCHSRYILPAFPFVFVWISQVAHVFGLKNRPLMSATAIAAIWLAGSSLFVYPHSLSYFNELVGGPTRGHAHLLDSNIDWGQDFLYLKRWLDSHPEARPLKLAHRAYFDPIIVGIEPGRPPLGPMSTNRRDLDRSDHLGPRPGWYAISVNQLRARTQDFSYFLHFEPVAMAGYSIYIYHVTREEANRVRRESRLPELAEGWRSSEEGRDGGARD